MKWLLTVRADADLDALRRELARVGVTVDLGSCIPLDDGEQVVEAEGPEELGATLERAGIDVLKVSPSSDLELFGPGGEVGDGDVGP
jgi:hypothetical protein